MAGQSWSTLPGVIIVEILSYLTLRDRLNAASTCRRWRTFLFQPKLWPVLVLALRRNRRDQAKFLTDVCGRFVQECSIQFDPHSYEEVKECFKILQCLTENKNIKVLQLQPSSCFTEWIDTVPCCRFIENLKLILQSNRKLKHLSMGCSEELLAYSGDFLGILSSLHSNSLESLHIASVKEDSENYGIVDIDIHQFRNFLYLKHLSIDYDYLDNEFLHIFSESGKADLKTLCIHIHGIDPAHEKVTDASWRHFATRNKQVEVTFNLVHSFVGVSKLLDILKPNLPLAHLRMFFCSSINIAAIGLMSQFYSATLKSIHIVDGYDGESPARYVVTTNEDPFVMLAWKCTQLNSFTLIGYEVCAEDIVAIARLRGETLTELNIPRCCIKFDEEAAMLGSRQGFENVVCQISLSLGREWQPLEDENVPAAVFNAMENAELAYNDILLKDQRYGKN